MDEYRVALLNDDVIPPGENDWPFQRPTMNDGYASLFERARRRQLPLVLANDADYADGRVKRGWVWGGERYVAMADVPLAGVYDQFQSGAPRGRWLTQDLRDRGLRVINDPKVTLVVDDKLLSYMNFPELVPYTHYFHAGFDDPKEAVEAFQDGCLEQGWGEVTSFVAKPQTGWGAQNLFRFSQENIGEIYQIPPGEYVLQPFLESSNGIPELGVTTRHDYRILLENGRFVTSMIRQPARHDWAANYYNADQLIFVVDEEDVPADFMAAARLADSRFEEFYPRLISFDMARLNSGRMVCWEMNSRPGMCADSNRSDDQQSSAQLQEGILNCLEIIVGWR